MANEKQVKVGGPGGSALVTEVNRKKLRESLGLSENLLVTPPAKVVGEVASPLDLSRLERVLLVGLVTMGYLANGGRPNTPQRIEELRNLIANVEELI